MQQISRQGKPVQVLRFRLLGQYPKSIEFFKLHFEEDALKCAEESEYIEEPEEIEIVEESVSIRRKKAR